MVVNMSEKNLKEIDEYLDRFAIKNHITKEQALDYVMIKLSEKFKKEEVNG
jgi:hypothetical protein